MGYAACIGAINNSYRSFMYIPKDTGLETWTKVGELHGS
jgi:hypothetical protein